MNSTQTADALLSERRPSKIYSNSALRVARHFWFVRENANVLALADALQSRPEIPVVAVVADDETAKGVIRRDDLFALIGKPFGREVLSRSCAAEIADPVEALDASADIFAVAQTALGDADRVERGFHPLRAERGAFAGILSAQDLSNYLSKMTRDDIEMAGRLQERLLAGNDLRAVGRCRLDAWSRSAKGVGGDFYYTCRIDDTRTFVALCDVSGKGVAASIVVSMVWGMLRMFDYDRGLSRLIVELNRAVVSTFHLEKYLTGFFLIYDSADDRIRCADMGHSHVMLLRDGSPHRVRGKRLNLPIGVETVIDPAVHSFRLKAEDVLLAFTDGITEQENEAGDEFGEKRFADAAARAAATGLPLEEAIARSVDAFRGAAPQQDDMSCVMLRLVPKQAGTE